MKVKSQKPIANQSEPVKNWNLGGHWERTHTSSGLSQKTGFPKSKSHSYKRPVQQKQRKWCWKSKRTDTACLESSSVVKKWQKEGREEPLSQEALLYNETEGRCWKRNLYLESIWNNKLKSKIWTHLALPKMSMPLPTIPPATVATSGTC